MRVSSEGALIDRLKQGDQAAVAELVRHYGPKVFRIALRYLRNHEDAEEMSQDVMFKVADRIDTFRGEATLASWIYRITFNQAMSRLRSTRADRVAMDASDQSAGGAGEDRRQPMRDRFEPADWSSLGDEHVMRGQLREELADAVRELPPIYRAPVILRDIRGLTTEEASAMLNVKGQTLKSRLHRGRLILRERLQNFAGGLSLHRPLPA